MSAYVLHYTSENSDGTWSVYREEYQGFAFDEPVDGSQTLMSTYATEAEANHEARRLQTAGWLA